MRRLKALIWLSILAGLLMALVSFLGIADPRTYGKEAPNWAAQGVGQDYVNSCVVFPVLLISSALVLQRNSFRALLVWLGTLIYMTYSYILYSFFVHFGPLFLLYVATLGFSFYAFVGTLAALDWQSTAARFTDVKAKPVSVLLGIVAVLFTLLWLADIVSALLRGGIPADLEEIGLPVNPIHVLDLAFLLPGAFIVSVLVWRRRTLGMTLAVPLLVFFVLMGLAIISMMIVTAQKGFSLALPQMVVMGIIIFVSSVIAAGYIKSISPTVLLVIISVLVFPPASRAESLASKNKEGNRLFAEGKFEDAEKAYLDAQVKNPGRPEILYNLGNSLIKQKKYGEGFQALRQAIEKGDKGVKQNSWFNLGDGLFLMGDYKASADAFIEALKLDPADPDAKHNLEMALRKLKEQEQQEQQEQAGEKERQEKKESAVGSRQSAVNNVEEGKQQEPQQQKHHGRFTEEQAIQLLEAIQNQEREEQRKAMERRGSLRTNEKDW